MTDRQMELGFGNARDCYSATPRQRRLSRANWWFERMRRVVERALDWQPAALPRPEQIWFGNPSRQEDVNPDSGSTSASQETDRHERQICE